MDPYAAYGYSNQAMMGLPEQMSYDQSYLVPYDQQQYYANGGGQYASAGNGVHYNNGGAVDGSMDGSQQQQPHQRPQQFLVDMGYGNVMR